MNAVITITSDFGADDGYVAAMKGVILSTNPAAQLVDITHRIAPQNVFQAAFVVGTAYAFFPAATVHLAVVDPGVGTDRRVIILRTPDGTFIGPDNGIFSYALRNYTIGKADGSLQQVRLASEARAVSVTNSRFFRRPLSDTFHGRDIMAPVAALLSQGFQINAFGEAVDRLYMLPLPEPEENPDGSITGHVLHIDAFGNIITDVGAAQLPAGREIRIELKSHLVSGLQRSYAEGSGLLAVIGSSGYLEIAVKSGSAVALTEARIGDNMTIRAGA